PVPRPATEAARGPQDTTESTFKPPSAKALDRLQAALTDKALRRLAELRGWSPEACRKLGLGLEGDRIVFPVRDAAAVLVAVSRFVPSPEPRTGPKMQADPGSRRELFPAPETLGDGDVWIVEGEPDAVAAATLGLRAVGVPGANCWRSEWAKRFAGRYVRIIPDCDPPGRALAGRVAADLAQHAADVRVVDLDPGRDDGHDLGDLLVKAGEAGRGELRRLLERMADAVEPVDAVDPVRPAAKAGPEPSLHQTPLSSTGREPQWPAPLDPAALHGLAGEIVETIGPHTEADPAALLVTLLGAFGSAAGRGPGWRVGGDFHATNLYAAFVGDTSSGRKGTSWGEIRRLMEHADPEWTQTRVATGLSSGEGLVHHVRDDLVTRRRARTKKEKQDADHDGLIEEVDPGVSDKRLLVVEGELALCFKVMRREGNTLSPVIRGLWDQGTAGNLTKNAPERTTGAHVSIIGHVTPRELRDGLTEAERANGFANRFLFVCVRRARSLPFGGELSEGEIAEMGRRLGDALAFARDQQALDMDAEARQAWEAIYEPLTERPDGMLGAITGRAVPLVRRLAVIYALLDHQTIVGLCHLRAALSVWDYCERSAAYAFGGVIGDRLADRLLAELRKAGPSGLTRSEIRAIVGHRLGVEEVGRALEELEARGLARCERHPTGGRPQERWHIVERGGKPRSVEESPRSSTFLHQTPLSSTALDVQQALAEPPADPPSDAEREAEWSPEDAAAFVERAKQVFPGSYEVEAPRSSPAAGRNGRGPT
ncbi:MAG: DUF3987 domain-containing protein, partial [Thermoleophilaceae bacterium]|nr:DUF3987 domain-containing protein [Thermoleophilaceae bacterium]